jgi:hypothetical protein
VFVIKGAKGPKCSASVDMEEVVGTAWETITRVQEKVCDI